MIFAAMASGQKPCCADLLLEMMQQLSGFLRQQNATHFLAFGSLLGAVRSGDVIPWTNDFVSHR